MFLEFHKNCEYNSKWKWNLLLMKNQFGTNGLYWNSDILNARECLCGSFCTILSLSTHDARCSTLSHFTLVFGSRDGLPTILWAPWGRVHTYSLFLAQNLNKYFLDCIYLCGRLNNVPILSLGTCDYVTSHGKRNLQMRFNYPGKPNGIIKSFIREKQEY